MVSRKDAFFGLHFDLHANEHDTELGADVDEAMITRLLERVKPDYVQQDCKGHPGYTSYPTEVGWASPGIVLFCFSARSERRETRPSQEGSLHWISLDRLSEVDLVEDVPVLLERLARVEDPTCLAPPFSARYRYDDEDRLQIEFADL